MISIVLGMSKNIHKHKCIYTPRPKTDINVPRLKIKLGTAGSWSACPNPQATAVVTVVT